MKKNLGIVLILLLFTASATAEVGFKGRPITNNLRMPTGYTLNQGEFLVGIGPIGFGITDNVQLGTNILLFLFQYYNANLKISFIKSETSAFAAGIEFGYFNLPLIEDTNDKVSFTSISPYAVFTTKMGENTAIHLGGQYSFFKGDVDIEDAKVEETSNGTSVFAGLEQDLSHKTKFLAEGGYDITYNGFRIGGAVLFGWTSFRLKLGVNYFKPEGYDGFTLPAIGLWWRFNA